MRTRQYMQPGRLGGSDFVRKYNGFTNEFVSHHMVYVHPEPPKIHSIITDVPGRDAVFNDCIHHKRIGQVCGIPPVGLPFYDKYPVVTYRKYPSSNLVDSSVMYIPSMVLLNRAMMAFPGYLELNKDIRPILDRYLDYSRWVGERWTEPKVSLRTNGFSLVNFALEWKQSLQMAKDYLNVPQLLQRLRRCANINEPLKSARALSNERLTYVYGADLLVRDVSTFCDILMSWKARADKYLANSGKQQGCHKKPVRFIGSTTAKEPLPMFDIPGSYVTSRNHVRMRGHATLGYVYNVREMRWWIARIAQLSDSLGVNLDAGIAWDAVPLSFVVDWYVNVGDWLHSNWSSDWVKAEILLNDFCHSGKITIERSLEWEYYDPDGHYNDDNHHILWTDKTTHYHRQRDKIPLHGGVELVDRSGEPWKIDRIINATALTTQRVLKPRNFKGRKVSRMLTKIKQILAKRKK